MRPSYEQIRVLIHAERRRREADARQRELLWQVYVGHWSPKAIFEAGHRG